MNLAPASGAGLGPLLDIFPPSGDVRPALLESSPHSAGGFHLLSLPQYNAAVPSPSHVSCGLCEMLTQKMSCPLGHSQ